MNTLPIHLAPLQGYTEAAYRNAHAAVFGGVDVYHTPFVRIDRGEFRHKDVRDILPENNSAAGEFQVRRGWGGCGRLGLARGGSDHQRPLREVGLLTAEVLDLVFVLLAQVVKAQAVQVLVHDLHQLVL